MTAESAHNQKLLLVPYADDPLETLGRRLLQDHREVLPNLTNTVLLLPDMEAAPRLRRILLKQANDLGYDALLGPHVLSWRSWLNTFPCGSSEEVVNNHRRELILVEALREHETLFGKGNLWALADSLLTLFDELTLNRVGLPRNLNEFTRRVALAYGAGEQGHPELARESQLVHTLWHAWHEELNARKLLDRHTRYLLQLSSALRTDPRRPLYLMAPDTLSDSEHQWLNGMLRNGNLTLILHGRLEGVPSRRCHPQMPLHRLFSRLEQPLPETGEISPLSRMLDTVYLPSAEEGIPLRQRALEFASTHPQSPAKDRLSLLGADGDEEEAHAAELQVRQWLLAGKQHIGIVTENRRLARRIRALLERAGIILQDAAGWALSTTSAAAALERWLECIEEDFPQLAMLDLLKSPFFVTELTREEHLNRVFRLEQDIIQHENISSSLERYRENLRYRQQRLPRELAARLEPVDKLLAELETAASSLKPYASATAISAAILLKALLASLEAIGLHQSLGEDAAGMRLLEELEQMQQAVKNEPVTMTWLEFRGWLGRTLERFHFRPPVIGGAVSLLGLSQTPLARFDGLVIAGAEREHLPGTPAATPFFNDAVRRELGLPGGAIHLAERFSHFRRLLESAPEVLITYRRHKDGEELLPSPWVENLRAFHLLAYNDELHNEELASLLPHPDTRVVQRQAPLPSPIRMPAPSLQPDLLPRRYSASAYQQLMDCPYQFYAARGLSLAPPEAVRDALEKSDYGERVHLCLQAFHQNVEGLPGPFTGRLTSVRRPEAEELLQRISRSVFASDLEDNFLHRGWLQRWLEKIPGYLDWQTVREEHWLVKAVEARAEQRNAIPGITLHGRLDRIDSGGGGQAIVDYKTGHIPSLEEVESGEAVQLPFYTLLAPAEEPVAEVSYLMLDQKQVREKVTVQSEVLEDLSRRIKERLESVAQAMLNGAKLPAWGDENSCGYCNMAGICRRQAWEAEIKKAT